MSKLLKSIVTLAAACLLCGAIGQNVTRPNVKGPNGFEVNSYTGNLFHSRTDMRVAALPLPVDFTFYYNQSRRTKNWGMGPGWSFTYNAAYTPDSLGMYIERGDGRRDLFKKAGNIYTSPAGVFDKLAEYATSKFKLTARDGTVWYFDNGVHKKLTKIQDRNNNSISLSYTDSLLSQLTDMNSHTYSFTWTNGRLTQITDNCTTPVRKITYDYDTTGNPVKVTNPLGDYVSYYYTAGKMTGYSDERDYRMSMTYTPNNAVEKLISCITTQSFSYAVQQRKTFVTELVSGQKQFTTYTFDTTGRVVQKQGNCCGYNVAYQYDPNNDIAAVKNGNSQTTKYEYDSRGNVIKETDVLGNAVTYTYDTTFNKVKSVKDRRGITTLYEYDATGNRNKIIKPGGITEKYTYDTKGNVSSYTDGNGYKTSYAYNSDGFVTKQTDATNHSINYTYDCHGNRTTETDARGNTNYYEYNALNQLVKVTDPYNKTTQYHYDKAGNLETVTNPLGKTTNYLYDGLNRRIKTVTPMGISTQTVYDEQGNVSKTIDGNGNATTYTYNSRKQVLTETDALGNTTSYNYDDAGNQKSMTDKNGGIKSFEYDELNRLVKQVNAINGSITYTYDENGNRITQTDANGNLNTFEYDSLNRIKKLIDPFKNTVEYKYDENNNIINVKDKNGNNISYGYDSLNRVNKTIDANGGIRKITYDENGNVLSEIDQVNHAITYTYDKLNRRVNISNALNETTIYTYDAGGNNIAVVQSNNNAISKTYDDDNRLVEIVDAIGSLAHYAYDGNGNLIQKIDGNGNIIRFEYNAINRKTKRFDALNQATIYSYDANGNLIKEIDRNGHPKSYAYDALGRKVSETDALSYTTRFSYDNNSNRLNIIDAKGNIISFSYDVLNRLTKEIYADGTTQQFTYDANGNRKTRKDGNGVITNYSYDGMNRMKKRSYPDGSSDDFSYDLAGRKLTANNSNATVSYTYDDADRIVLEKLNDKITTYSYNTSINTRSIDYPNGRKIIERRDKRNRLSFITDNNDTAVVFTYDLLNNLKEKRFINGYIESYSYNANNWMTDLVCYPSVNFSYTYDNEGHRLTTQKNSDSIHSEVFKYDSVNQLIQFDQGLLRGATLFDTNSHSIYNYDPLHNRTYSKEDSMVKFYEANNVNAYTKVSSNGQLTNYTYDLNGNVISNGTRILSYDFENRLKKINYNYQSEFFYDALGRKVKTKKNLEETSYYFDGNRVVEQTSNLSSKIKTILYGSGLDDVISFTKSDSTFHLVSHIDGTPLVALDSNNVVEKYDYLGFGDVKLYDSNSIRLTSSIIGNEFYFKGRSFIDSDFYDYRTRVYSPGVGRFYERDQLGYTNDVNLYRFLNNSPINYNDPYGTYVLIVVEGVIIIAETVEEIAIIVRWLQTINTLRELIDVLHSLRWVSGKGLLATKEDGETEWVEGKCKDLYDKYKNGSCSKEYGCNSLDCKEDILQRILIGQECFKERNDYIINGCDMDSNSKRSHIGALYMVQYAIEKCQGFLKTAEPCCRVFTMSPVQ